MKRIIGILCSGALWLLVTASLLGGEVAGVKMSDSATVEGKNLRLNGMGLRKKVIFKVYVAGLYLENPSKDASTVLSSEQVKSIHLRMLRSISGSELSDSIGEAFWRNAGPSKSTLNARLQKLKAMFPSVVPGDLIVLTYVPGKGTAVSAKDQQKGIVEGKDFSDALFSVWLGPDPVQPDLKKLLLGN